MKKIAVAIAAVALSSLSVPAMAGDRMTGDEIKEFFSVARTYVVAWGSGNTGDVTPDGKTSAWNSRSSSEGTWTVNEAGEFCVTWNNSQWTGGCSVFEKTDDPDTVARTFLGTRASQTYKRK